MKHTLSLLTALVLAPLAALHAEPLVAGTAPPNVLIVMTDDQGYGELSAHGNPVLKTPNLDRLCGESVRFTDFHVAPMCTPTRGQLMTGVDALRNGAMNVSSGRTLLHRDLPTMPQIFAAAGYATGIFGKWHLGDTLPYRPEDRGFHEALWFPSSHIGSVPDFWENDYFDDIYIRNGARQRFTGYTTDVFFREAIAWMKQQAVTGKPFLCYLPTAAPHSPHFVPEAYRQAVRADFDRVKESLPKLPPQKAADLLSYLAMIANIDENVGRLDAALREAGVRDNTITVFLTDNGGTFGPDYFHAGMKGRKTTLWEGGHRVPLFVRWPAGKLRVPGEVAGLTQVQDLLPTLLELCRVKPAMPVKFDGVSLAPVLRGTAEPPPERMLVINYSRMPFGVHATTAENPAVPKRDGACVLWKRWRLLEDRELYNLDADPMQERNVIAQYPDVVAMMRSHLDSWWAGVKGVCHEFQPSVIGDDRQNPVTLTACEWADVFVDQQAQVRRGERKNGVWHLEVARAGSYTFELRRFPAESGLPLSAAVAETRATDGMLGAGPAFDVAGARLRIGDQLLEVRSGANDASAHFTLALPAGRTTMQTWLLDAVGQEIAGAYYVTVERLDKDAAKTTKEATSSADPNNRPNILLIVADDLGYGDVGCYGSTKIRTPRMDRLAADGVRFADAHSTAAVCNPSRYAILAGTYLHHAKRANDYSLYFHDGQITLPSLLQSAGYRTAALGKWHNGFGRKGDPDYNAELKPGPLEIGFDSFFGTPRTHNEPPWVFVENHRVVGWDPADPIRIISHDEVLRRGLKDHGWGLSEGAANAHAARPDERIDLIIAEKAAAFLSRAPKETPFFLYVAFAAPHSPVNPAPEFRGRSQAGIYGDYVEQLDHCIGRVLDALDACGAAHDTLVIVTSDNGAVCTRDAIAAGHRSNGVLLGQKTDAWEGGHRVPLIARWPGRIPAGSERQALFTQVDIMATLAEAAGAEMPPGASPDGISGLAAFTDPERAPAKRTEALFQGTGSYALRQGDWLYIPRQGSGGMTVQVPPRAPWGLPYAKMNQHNSDIDPQGKVQPGAPPAQLYNLRDDLTQTTNRFRDQPDTAKRLAARMEELLSKPTRPGKP